MLTSETKIRHTFSFILISIFILTSGAYSADKDSFWPQFHGPNRDNISTEKGLLKSGPRMALNYFGRQRDWDMVIPASQLRME